MSRSGYVDDSEQWALIRWRGAVASAIRGRRGQAFLSELRAALLRMRHRRLIAEALEEGGEVCALGALGLARSMDMTEIDSEDSDAVAGAFDIPHALACEIQYENDETLYQATPERRFEHMLCWVEKNLKVGPTKEVE